MKTILWALWKLVGWFLLVPALVTLTVLVRTVGQLAAIPFWCWRGYCGKFGDKWSTGYGIGFIVGGLGEKG